MNRIVQYYAQRPQVQERLTLQIVKELQKVLNTDDVSSSTVTSEFGGIFKNKDKKQGFLDYIKTTN